MAPAKQKKKPVGSAIDFLTPLHEAAFQCDLTKMRALLSSGADINADVGKNARSAEQRMTPLDQLLIGVGAPKVKLGLIYFFLSQEALIIGQQTERTLRAWCEQWYPSNYEILNQLEERINKQSVYIEAYRELHRALIQHAKKIGISNSMFSKQDDATAEQRLLIELMQSLGIQSLKAKQDFYHAKQHLDKFYACCDKNTKQLEDMSSRKNSPSFFSWQSLITLIARIREKIFKHRHYQLMQSEESIITTPSTLFKKIQQIKDKREPSQYPPPHKRR